MKPTMKPFFTTLLSSLLLYFAVYCTAAEQVSNVPALRAEVSDIVAEVNGDKITRTSLAAECLQLHGEKEIKALAEKADQTKTETADSLRMKVIEYREKVKRLKIEKGL